MEGVPLSEYGSLFKIAPEVQQNSFIIEFAADRFALWALGAKVSKAQEDFFLRLLTEWMLRPIMREFD